MGDTFRLAMQLTMIDLLSGVADRARAHIKQLGDQGKAVAKDFELMEINAKRGLKTIAGINYTIKKVRPGVEAAADLQESMTDVQMSLMRSGKDAATLGRELAAVRATAVDLQKITPFSAVDVVEVQKELLNSGLDFNEVVGKGATRAAMMLATITKESPSAASAAMLNIGIPYHLKSSEYGEVADVIQRHVMSGRMKLPDLNAALPYLAPVAKNFKVPWDDMLTGLAVLGEQGQLGSMAGTHLKDFYGRLTGASRISRKVMAAVNQDLKAKGNPTLDFWDSRGELKPTHDLIKNLRGSLGGYTTKQRMFILEKIFGEQGGLAAMGLMNTGTGSWEFIKEKMVQLASAEDKMNVRLTAFNANVTALKGTAKTTLANLFDPALGTLTKIVQKGNDLTDVVGRLAGEHKGVTATMDALLGIGVATAGGYGLYKLAKGGFYGARMLKGLRGLPLVSAGIGIAEGKAVQAATGVQPVFVTNWPGSLGGAPLATAAEAAAGGAAAGRVSAAAAKSQWAGRFIAGAAPWAMNFGLPVAVTMAPFVGKALSDAARDNGWGTRTIQHNSSEYEVMGIGKRPINLTVQIDSQGRVFSRSDDPATRFSTMKRGAFFENMLVSH